MKRSVILALTLMLVTSAVAGELEIGANLPLADVKMADVSGKKVSLNDAMGNNGIRRCVLTHGVRANASSQNDSQLRQGVTHQEGRPTTRSASACSPATSSPTRRPEQVRIVEALYDKGQETRGTNELKAANVDAATGKSSE